MTEITRDEIEKRLLKLNDPWRSAAFAVRIATLALLHLTDGVKEGRAFLWYWEKKQQKHLVSVLRAWQSSWISIRFFVKFNNRTADVSASAAADAAASASASASAAAAATYAADAATYAATSAAAASAASAASAAAYAYAASRAFPSIFVFKKGIVESYLLEVEENADIVAYLEKSFVPDSKQDLFIQELKKLGNGFDYWADWYAARLRGESLDEELARKIIELPEEIFEQSPAEINAYLKSLSHAASPLNRVRIIFMGFGEAGKTSIIRVLRGEQVIEGKEPMTPGIDIHELIVPDAEDKPWQVPNIENQNNQLVTNSRGFGRQVKAYFTHKFSLRSKPNAEDQLWQVPKTNNQLTAHLWDFGGQVMAHSTHKFFLRSNCLYVLVLNNRTEIDGNEQAEYWLTHVQAYSGNAPVMIVGNKLDEVKINLNMSYLREKYKNIVDFYPISCTQAHGKYQAEFKRFERDLITELQEVGTRQVLFTEQHFTALKELRSCAINKSFLAKEAFADLCLKQGIKTQGELNQDWFLDLLDKLGVIIHFPQMKRLNEYVLNPRWLTYGIYTLLYSETAKQAQGKLHEDQVFEILSNKKLQDNQGTDLSYPNDKCGFIIDAMEQFEVAYRLSNNRHIFIIPALLPSDTPKSELGFEKADSQLVFSFDFSGFLPRHVIAGLIVRKHAEIERNVVWQNGVLLHSMDKQARALVQADYHDRRLTFWVQGTQASRYFTILHDEILQLIKEMADLKYTQWIKLPSEDPDARVSFRQLLALEQEGERFYIGEYGKFEVQELLGRVMPKEERAKQNIYVTAGTIGIAQIGKNPVGNMRDQK